MGLPYLVAAGVLLHLLFWGAGLAMLAMPRPWRNFWPVLMAPAGMALQSLVVWIGAHTPLAGTRHYAWPAELIPVALIILGRRRTRRAGARGLAAFAGLGAVMAALLAVLVRPLTLAASGLTTVSLGSCDAADYAGGARVLMDFAHSDRGGFLGLKEVVQVMSVDNFFDFWLRLNHFTPSALIALNGTIFDCAPEELTGLLTVVALVGAVPVVFWMARALFGYGTALSLGIAALFGLSPLMWYAVYEVAIGQLLAAPAIALLTWAGVALWRGRLGLRRAVEFGGVLAIGYTLVLGSYNFIIVVCFVPALAFAGEQALRTRCWSRLARWAFAMAAPLGLVVLIQAERVAGLIERFLLFRTYDFGWRIPGLTPEGWVGMVAGPSLAPWPAPWHGLFAAVVAVAMVAALATGATRRDRRVLLVLACTVPVLMGYAFLLWHGAHFGTNASYDAYKLFSVFFPVLLPAFAYAVAGRRTAVLARLGAAALILLVVAINLVAADRFAVAVRSGPLVVDRDMQGLRQIEAMPEVASLNLRVPEMWPRLWANGFLLRKPHYFPTHTYEGRRNAPMRGEWDLNGGLISVVLPDQASKRLNAQYSLVRVGSPYYLRMTFGDGWYETERLPHSTIIWRWSTGDASLWLDNPQPRARQAILRLDGSSLAARDLELSLGDRLWRTVRLPAGRAPVRLEGLVIPPGLTRLELKSVGASSLVAGDSRPLGFAAYGIELEVLPDAKPRP